MRVSQRKRRDRKNEVDGGAKGVDWMGGPLSTAISQEGSSRMFAPFARESAEIMRTR